MIDRPSCYGSLEHLLKAKRLGRELQIVIDPAAPLAMLVFDGIHRTVGMKLHDIAAAGQAQPPAPHRQSIFHPHSGAYLMSLLIDTLVLEAATQRVDVLSKRLLHVNQRALARAVAVVLQGGDYDGVVRVVTGHGPTFFPTHR